MGQVVCRGLPLARAGPRGAPGSGRVLSLAEARHRGVLLATHMDGQHLPFEHGAPLRLVVPADWDCFSGVKWVQRVELTEERAEATGPAIALPASGGGIPGTRSVHPLGVTFAPD